MATRITLGDIECTPDKRLITIDRNTFSEWHVQCGMQCILHCAGCEKQMTNARTTQYISNFFAWQLVDLIKQCELTLIKIVSSRQEPRELFTCSNHIQTVLRLLQSVFNDELTSRT